MTLAEQWREIEANLPEDWSAVRLKLTISEDEHADRAALILAPLGPGRVGSTFRFTVRRATDPARVFRRLDSEGIRGRVDLLQAEKAKPPAAREERGRPFLEQWEDLVERLPPDWSDLYAEIEFDSSDFLQRGALLLSPLNPARYGGPSTLRFRVARTTGYGTAASMARRCFERLDDEGITGQIRVLRVLSATSHVATQGPVWRVEGRSV